MPLGVDVGQDCHEEGRGLTLGDQLPTAGLAELREEEKRVKDNNKKKFDLLRRL